VTGFEDMVNLSKELYRVIAACASWKRTQQVALKSNEVLVFKEIGTLVRNINCDSCNKSGPEISLGGPLAVDVQAMSIAPRNRKTATYLYSSEFGEPISPAFLCLPTPNKQDSSKTALTSAKIRIASGRCDLRIPFLGGIR